MLYLSYNKFLLIYGRTPWPLRSSPSINSNGINSCSFLWKQTIACLTSDLSPSWCHRWCHSFPPSHSLLFFNLSSPHSAKRSDGKKEVKRRWRWRRMEGFSKSTQAAPTGITSSFFPFPSLPPLSICLSLFILHFFPPITSPFWFLSCAAEFLPAQQRSSGTSGP